MLLKVLKFEEKLEKFESLVEQLRQEKQDDQKAFQNRMSELDVEFEETQRMNNDMQRQMNKSLEIMDNFIRHSDKHTEELVRNITAHEDVAFTVKKPAGSSGIFEEIVTNEGSDYSTSDGTFTCRVPGLYFFSAYLVKYRTDKGSSSRVDVVEAYICMNRNKVTRLHIDPEDTTADYGSYGVSSAVYMRLKAGDTVSIDTSLVLEPWSTFNGLLVSRESG